MQGTTAPGTSSGHTRPPPYNPPGPGETVDPTPPPYNPPGPGETVDPTSPPYNPPDEGTSGQPSGGTSGLTPRQQATLDSYASDPEHDPAFLLTLTNLFHHNNAAAARNAARAAAEAAARAAAEADARAAAEASTFDRTPPPQRDAPIIERDSDGRWMADGRRIASTNISSDDGSVVYHFEDGGAERFWRDANGNVDFSNGQLIQPSGSGAPSLADNYGRVTPQYRQEHHDQFARYIATVPVDQQAVVEAAWQVLTTANTNIEAQQAADYWARVTEWVKDTAKARQRNRYYEVWRPQFGAGHYAELDALFAAVEAAPSGSPEETAALERLDEVGSSLPALGGQAIIGDSQESGPAVTQPAATDYRIPEDALPQLNQKYQDWKAQFPEGIHPRLDALWESVLATTGASPEEYSANFDTAWNRVKQASFTGNPDVVPGVRTSRGGAESGIDWMAVADADAYAKTTDQAIDDYITQFHPAYQTELKDLYADVRSDLLSATTNDEVDAALKPLIDRGGAIRAAPGGALAPAAVEGFADRVASALNPAPGFVGVSAISQYNRKVVEAGQGRNLGKLPAAMPEDPGGLFSPDAEDRAGRINPETGQPWGGLFSPDAEDRTGRINPETGQPWGGVFAPDSADRVGSHLYHVVQGNTQVLQEWQRGQQARDTSMSVVGLQAKGALRHENEQEFDQLRNINSDTYHDVMAGIDTVYFEGQEMTPREFALRTGIAIPTTSEVARTYRLGDDAADDVAIVQDLVSRGLLTTHPPEETPDVVVIPRPPMDRNPGDEIATTAWKVFDQRVDKAHREGKLVQAVEHPSIGAQLETGAKTLVPPVALGYAAHDVLTGGETVILPSQQDVISQAIIGTAIFAAAPYVIGVGGALISRGGRFLVRAPNGTVRPLTKVEAKLLDDRAQAALGMEKSLAKNVGGDDEFRLITERGERITTRPVTTSEKVTSALETRVSTEGASGSGGSGGGLGDLSQVRPTYRTQQGALLDSRGNVILEGPHPTSVQGVRNLGPTTAGGRTTNVLEAPVTVRPPYTASALNPDELAAAVRKLELDQQRRLLQPVLDDAQTAAAAAARRRAAFDDELSAGLRARKRALDEGLVIPESPLVQSAQSGLLVPWAAVAAPAMPDTEAPPEVEPFEEPDPNIWFPYRDDPDPDTGPDTGPQRSDPAPSRTSPERIDDDPTIDPDTIPSEPGYKPGYDPGDLPDLVPAVSPTRPDPTETPSPGAEPFPAPVPGPLTEPEPGPEAEPFAVPEIEPFTTPGIEPFTTPGIEPFALPAPDTVTAPAPDTVTAPESEEFTAPEYETGRQFAPFTVPGTEPVTAPGTEPVTAPGSEEFTAPEYETGRQTSTPTAPGTEPVTAPGTEPVTAPELEEFIAPEYETGSQTSTPTAPAPLDLPGGGPLDAPAPLDLPGGGPLDAPAPLDLPGGGPLDAPAPLDLPGGGPLDAPAPLDLPGGGPLDAPASLDLSGGGPLDAPAPVDPLGGGSLGGGGERPPPPIPRPRRPRLPRLPSLDGAPGKEIPNTGGDYPAVIEHRAETIVTTDADTGEHTATLVELKGEPEVVARQAEPASPKTIRGRNLDVEVLADGSVEMEAVHYKGEHRVRDRSGHPVTYKPAGTEGESAASDALAGSDVAGRAGQEGDPANMSDETLAAAAAELGRRGGKKSRGPRRKTLLRLPKPRVPTRGKPKKPKERMPGGFKPPHLPSM